MASAFLSAMTYTEGINDHHMFKGLKLPDSIKDSVSVKKANMSDNELWNLMYTPLLTMSPLGLVSTLSRLEATMLPITVSQWCLTSPVSPETLLLP